MAYDPTDWRNGQTGINETRLNKIEQELALVSKSLKYNGVAPSDLNTARTHGTYKLETSYSNAPIDGNLYGILIVYVTDGQTWVPRSGNTGGQWIWQEIRCTSGDIYIRGGVNTADSWTDWSQISYKDSGWINGTLTSGFKAHGDASGNIPRYRKIGNIVEVVGAVTPTANIADTTTSTTIFTLPAGYRPSRFISKLCQGSAKKTWLLRLGTDGKVEMQRYGSTNFEECPVGDWLPFEIMFMV